MVTIRTRLQWLEVIGCIIVANVTHGWGSFIWSVAAIAGMLVTFADWWDDWQAYKRDRVR